MAILYGDTITDSMKRAIDETNRRRAKQIAFNAENGITPRGVTKSVREMIDGVYDVKSAKQGREALKEKARIGDMDEREVSKEIKRLEKAMLEHAKNLEFEQAAQVRDQLSVLKEQVFGASGQNNILALVPGDKAA